MAYMYLGFWVGNWELWSSTHFRLY